MFTHAFTGIPVTDIDVAVDWYTRLVGRPPDLIPNEDEAAWQLTDSAWIYVEVDGGRAGTGLHALMVDALDAFVAEIGGRGLEVSLEKTGDGLRFALITDPYGNQLKVARPPS